jgi:small-conductance mechanosensitive channel
MGFVQGILQAVVVIAAVIRIMTMTSTLDKIYNTVILSSSMLVVVLGFMFQEGMKNIMHGFFISIYKPFEVGDRVSLKLDSGELLGYVDGMTLRHTVIRQAATNTLVYIPNTVMDSLPIFNFNNGKDVNSQILSVQITYESDLDKAKQLFSDAILATPGYEDTREPDRRQGPVGIGVSDLNDEGIVLTTVISAKTQEELYDVCSGVRENVLRAFKKEGISIAYRHVQVLGEMTVHSEGSD